MCAFIQFTGLVDLIVSGGYVAALAAICALQYVIHLIRTERMRRQKDQFRRQVCGLESELDVVQTERILAGLENSILREFVAQTEIEHALDLLLHRFVPDPRQGLAAFLQLEPERRAVQRSRGLSASSRQGLRIEGPLLERVRQERMVALESDDLDRSRLLGGLSRADRRKVHQLFLLPVGDVDELAGLFLTSSLYPVGAPREQQVALAHRLLMSVADNVRRTRVLERKDHQLRSTSEQLELRAIGDRQHESPRRMLEAFIGCLLEKVGAERGSLYLRTPDAVRPHRMLVRCGVAVPPGLLVRWHEHEDCLADLCLRKKHLETFDRAALEQIGVNSLVGSAVTAPLVHHRTVIGLLCLTKRAPEPMANVHCQLADWAADYLAGTLRRVLNQAAVERQARQDGLTGLANRRTFDQRIERELQTAERSTAECSLLLLDIDRFKPINDTLGHQAGDEVLRRMAAILREQAQPGLCGPRPLLARYGGEELAVLLPGVGTAAALRVGEAIRSAVASTPVDFQQRTIQVTLSGGVGTYPHHATSVVDLIAAADAALYQAKESGRNRVVCAAEAPVRIP